jgi:Zn-dependent protease with chaperone function
MTDALSLILHLIYIIAIFTIVSSVVCWILSPLFKTFIEAFSLESKLTFLRFFGALPLSLALGLTSTVTVPALSHDTSLPLEHCHTNSDCLGASASHMLTPTELIIASFFCSFLLWRFFLGFRSYYRSKKLFNRLDFLTEAKHASLVKSIDTPVPFAFSIGIFKPIAIISSGLRHLLSSRQIKIISLHEEVHIKHRDNLDKWLMQLVCSFHCRAVKQYILELHALTLEMRADQIAARVIDSSVDVAETIVIVKRLMSTEINNPLVCQFISSELEQRVHYLLVDKPEKSLSKKTIKWSAFSLFLLAIIFSLPLHNAIEFLIR